MSNGMVAQEEVDALDAELKYAHDKWAGSFDGLNTLSDWVTYITQYASKSARMDYNKQEQYDCLIKAAGLALNAATRVRTGDIAPRHFDALGAGAK